MNKDKYLIIIIMCFVFIAVLGLISASENARLKKTIENQNMLIEILNRSCECECEFE